MDMIAFRASVARALGLNPDGALGRRLVDRAMARLAAAGVI